MFLTFSRGYTVSQAEVIELFARLYGRNFIAALCMHENIFINEHPLYARIVFDSVEFVNQIFNGEPVKRFKVKVNHTWAKKYERWW